MLLGIISLFVIPACMVFSFLPPLGSSNNSGGSGGDQAGNNQPAPEVGKATPSPTSPKSPSGGKATPTETPTSATYQLVFDSTIGDMLGKEHVYAKLLLKTDANGKISGETPLKIVQADGDNLGGAGCTSSNFTEDPGNFKVVSITLTYNPGASSTKINELQNVVLVYSLNPQIQCGDGTFGPNDWNLFWLVYDGHFNFTKDILDDTGPEPLITSTDWTVKGDIAQKTYHWSAHGITEDTTISLTMVSP